ncbi:hypothetical protein ACUN0C_19070 [Faunimonas sp. B44]|uniref:hypothetical protein n=1 Tax=Faunimonas sp. B44 TaxID=3461493 RepID=UPI004043965D
MKAGDKVRCIDPTGHLVEGKVYTVESVRDGLIYTNGFGFFADRFVPVEDERRYVVATRLLTLDEALLEVMDNDDDLFIAEIRRKLEKAA